jgi:hypothetical protein
MKNYFITAGAKCRVPTEISHVAIPDGWQVIVRTNSKKTSLPHEKEADHIPMFRFGYTHISITNKCW